MRIHLRVGQQSLEPLLGHVRLRASIVFQLMKAFMERGHLQSRQPDLEAMQRRVQMRYPANRHGSVDDDQSDGAVPSEVTAAIETARNDIKKSKVLQENVATSSEFGEDPETLFDRSRPASLNKKRSSKNAEDLNEVRAIHLSRFSERPYETGSTFVDQWRPTYVSEAFPCTLTYPVGGPEFFNQHLHPEKRPQRNASYTVPALKQGPDGKWTQTTQEINPAHISMQDFAHDMARRVEGQIRSAWDFPPAVRNLYFRHACLTMGSLFHHEPSQAGLPMESHATRMIQAAGGLYEKLWKGTYVAGSKKRRKIAGDTTKLKYAEGLTEDQRKIVRELDHRVSNLEGTQQIRLRMGHCIFGAMVFGDSIFLTISPSDRHFGLTLRLSRHRRNDPILRTGDDAEDMAMRVARADWPRLEAAPTLNGAL